MTSGLEGVRSGILDHPADSGHRVLDELVSSHLLIDIGQMKIGVEQQHGIANGMHHVYSLSPPREFVSDNSSRVR